MERIVVVGGSLAGLRACETLRLRGFTGSLVVVGGEPTRPYDRPPLSKAVLAGTWEADRIALRTSADLDALDVDWRLGVPAAALDLTNRRVQLDDGSEVAFDGMIIATGALTRRLPDQPVVDGVCELRTVGDALALRERLVPGHRLVVIGAGFVGLEAAATACGRGCQVTVLEGAPAPLIRGLGAEMGTAVAAVHGRRGVDVRCSVTVTGIDHDGQSVRAVQLGDGSLIPADTVLVGIGVRPATDWLEGSGLRLEDGVVCDATLQAGPPGVSAAGDCARWVNLAFGDGEEMRVEHWTNAAEQGAAAAANLLAVATGEPPTPYSAIPFFWSDQFDSRIQFLGRPAGDDDVRVIAGDTDGSFAAIYGSAGRLRAAVGVNMPKVVMPIRKLLVAGVSWDEALATLGGVA